MKVVCCSNTIKLVRFHLEFGINEYSNNYPHTALPLLKLLISCLVFGLDCLYLKSPNALARPRAWVVAWDWVALSLRVRPLETVPTASSEGSTISLKQALLCVSRQLSLPFESHRRIAITHRDACNLTDGLHGSPELLQLVKQNCPCC